MPRTWSDVERVPGLHSVLRQCSIRTAQLNVDGAFDEVLKLVLALVVLQRKRLALVDVQHLAGITIRDPPAQLVTPRLLDPRGFGPPELRTHAALYRLYPPMHS